MAGLKFFFDTEKYINTNIIGNFNIFESAKNYKVPHLIIASTSSVYGMKNFSNKNIIIQIYHFLYATKKITGNITCV